MSHAVMVGYLQLNSGSADGGGFRSSMAFHAIPIVCMCAVIYMGGIGIIPLTFICTGKTAPFGLTFLRNAMYSQFSYNFILNFYFAQPNRSQIKYARMA